MIKIVIVISNLQILTVNNQINKKLEKFRELKIKIILKKKAAFKLINKIKNNNLKIINKQMFNNKNNIYKKGNNKDYSRLLFMIKDISN